MARLMLFGMAAYPGSRRPACMVI